MRQNLGFSLRQNLPTHLPRQNKKPRQILKGIPFHILLYYYVLQHLRQSAGKSGTQDNAHKFGTFPGILGQLDPMEE